MHPVRPAITKVRLPFERSMAARSRRVRGLFTSCLLFSFWCLLPSILRAQGCAMCYTSASAARSTAKTALANGTLILLAPPMLFFALITVVVYRYRNKYRDESAADGIWPAAHHGPPFKVPEQGNWGIPADRELLEGVGWQRTAHDGRRTTHNRFPWTKQ